MAIAPPPADRSVADPGEPAPDKDFVARNGPVILLMIGVAFSLVAVVMIATGHPIVGDTLATTAVITIVLAIVVNRIVSFSWRDFTANLGEDHDDDR